MKHITDIHGQSELLYELFEKISNRNTFLLLGAGASISKEKGFLASSLIDFFQDKKHKELGIKDLITFVDLIEASEEFSRDEFDEYVDECLRSLEVTESHKIWLQSPGDKLLLPIWIC